MPRCHGYSIVYVGPSITTLTRMNMGYKIYTLDGNYSGSSYVSIVMCVCMLFCFYSVAYLGPGLTTYTQLNMGFRIYTIDATSSNVFIRQLVHVWWYIESWFRILLLLCNQATHPLDAIFTHSMSYIQAVLDYQVYFMNVSDANLQNSTKWQLEYTAKVFHH